MLDCFDSTYGCICICVYSVILFTVVIKLCLYVGLLKLCRAFLFFFLCSFFHSLLCSFSYFKFLNLFYFSTFSPLCAFPTVLSFLEHIPTTSPRQQSPSWRQKVKNIAMCSWGGLGSRCLNNTCSYPTSLKKEEAVSETQRKVCWSRSRAPKSLIH